MSTATRIAEQDINVLYDIMVESSTRLVSELYGTMTEAASESDAAVLASVSAIRARADAVDENDVAAIIAETVKFRAEREDLRA